MGPQAIAKEFVSEDKILSPEAIFSEQIIRDEVIASNAGRYLVDNSSGEGTVLVVLAAVRDIVFGYGLPERIKRNISFLKNKGKIVEESKGKEEVLSVLLNPTSQDSLSLPGTVQLRLALSYGDDEVPFLHKILLLSYSSIII